MGIFKKRNGCLDGAHDAEHRSSQCTSVAWHGTSFGFHLLDIVWADWIKQALFLLGTPNPQPSFFLVAAAIRLANSIGLHKRGSGFNLNPVEIEQRKRVFWIAYLLDKE